MATAVEIQQAAVEGKKGVEVFFKKRLELVQSRFEGVSGKVRGQVAELRKTLEAIPQQTLGKLKALIAKAPLDKVEKAVSDGVKLTEEAAQKLGLAKIADVSALKEALEGLHKKIEQLKQRVDAFVKAPEAQAPAAPAAAPAPAKE